MSAALRLEGASARRGAAVVLHPVDLAVMPGEVVGLVGANGSGKTTLMRATLGLMPLAGGRAMLGEHDVARLSEPRRASLAGYLPQERRVGWNLPVWRIAALGALGRPVEEARRRALEALTRVGLAGFEERGVLDLSGGERARALLARLLVTGAPALVADEPTGGLDPDAQLLALELFRQEARRGAAVLLSLHDLGLAARACDRLVVLRAGRIVAEGPPVQALSRQTLRDAFGLDGELAPSAAGLVLAAGRVQGVAAVDGV